VRRSAEAPFHLARSELGQGAQVGSVNASSSLQVEEPSSRDQKTSSRRWQAWRILTRSFSICVAGEGRGDRFPQDLPAG